MAYRTEPCSGPDRCLDRLFAPDAIVKTCQNMAGMARRCGFNGAVDSRSTIPPLNSGSRRLGMARGPPSVDPESMNSAVGRGFGDLAPPDPRFVDSQSTPRSAAAEQGGTLARRPRLSRR